MRRGLLAETAGLLDSSVHDVPELVAKLQEALRSAEKELNAQGEALVEYQARELLASCRNCSRCAGGGAGVGKMLNRRWYRSWRGR